jgi:hypothetical protein
MTDSPTSTKSTRRNPHPVVSGKLVLLGTAVGCGVLFLLVWVSLRSIERRMQLERPAQFWSERHKWVAPAVIKTTLVKPNAANAQYTYNKPRYRDTKFVIAPEEEQAVLACAELATPRSNPDFTDDTTRQALLQLADSHDNFYTNYLLATWHRLHGDTQTADDLYQQAIDDAPKIIVIRYTDTNGNPVPHLKLGTIDIGCDRVTDEGQTLDQRLVLVYPSQETDIAGRVYLPVYDTVYRPVTLPVPDGYTITYSHPEGWFKLPTRLGTLTATVIRIPVNSCVPTNRP